MMNNESKETYIRDVTYKIQFKRTDRQDYWIDDSEFNTIDQAYKYIDKMLKTNNHIRQYRIIKKVTYERIVYNYTKEIDINKEKTIDSNT